MTSGRAACIVFLCAAGFSCGCAGAGPKPQGPSAVFEIAARPSDKQIAEFNERVSSCYGKARGAKITYSISPDGAIAPFSQAVVDCIAQGSDAACAEFLECVGKKYSIKRR